MYSIKNKNMCSGICYLIDWDLYKIHSVFFHTKKLYIPSQVRVSDATLLKILFVVESSFIIFNIHATFLAPSLKINWVIQNLKKWPLFKKWPSYGLNRILFIERNFYEKASQILLISQKSDSSNMFRVFTPCQWLHFFIFVFWILVAICIKLYFFLKNGDSYLTFKIQVYKLFRIKSEILLS